MIQKLIFKRVKETLENKYGLDMSTADIRLAYVIYHLFVQEYDDIIQIRYILKGTYKNYINKNVDFLAFEKSVYRSLNKIFGTAKQRSNVKNLLAIKDSVEL